MGYATGLRELVQSELRALIPGVEFLRAEVDGVGAVRDRCPHGIERARRGEQLGNPDSLFCGHL